MEIIVEFFGDAGEIAEGELFHDVFGDAFSQDVENVSIVQLIHDLLLVDAIPRHLAAEHLHVAGGVHRLLFDGTLKMKRGIKKKFSTIRFFRTALGSGRPLAFIERVPRRRYPVGPNRKRMSLSMPVPLTPISIKSKS